MQVMIKLFATLREGRFKVENRELPTGSTVRMAVRGLGIKAEEAAIILINSRNADLDDELHQGDVLALFPPVGGG